MFSSPACIVVLEGYGAGGMACLPKPFRLEALTALLDAAIGHARRSGAGGLESPNE